ncbi:ATP synthase subunit mitochondrial-like isoform X1 [Brachionus plicatilis]|uniref:ATP synthase subunit mitochondrial-like isoform X1 n=1 Tax=Brachionus plicatilis TaxID=10195 RepID=A0A3M7SQW0_BRAPC|nr:ATP synthase subunit mitochondrial-like isoform X1 [Brachionus plicatilis]
MLYWRQAGLNYVQFSNIASRIVRRCVQENAKKDAIKREEAHARINKWQDGKMVQTKASN